MGSVTTTSVSVTLTVFVATIVNAMSSPAA